MDAHLLADNIDVRQRPLGNVFARQELVDRQRGIVAVRDGPDDVLWAKGSIAAKENLGVGRSECFWVDLRHVPLVELDANIALDPRKRIFLADRRQARRRNEDWSGSPEGTSLRRPLSSYSALTLSNTMPVSLPFS
jgi:hypothetical protein